MKVLFLDIDGVLNSEEYYIDKADINLMEEPFDPDCLDGLHRIIESTGAKIVLSSSWRGGWDKNHDNCALQGRLLDDYFHRYGMEIYDKTGDFCNGNRPLEIKKWIRDSTSKVTQYAILDDNDFGWKKYHMQKHVVLTDFQYGGLKEKHVESVISILNSKSFLRSLQSSLFSTSRFKMKI